MTTLFNQFHNWLHRRVSIAPLVVFRMMFGSLLLYSNYRTYEEGWISELYIDPIYHFGFVSWLTPLRGDGMYIIFGLLCLFAIGIMLGFLYRISTIGYFLLFTYVELLDKTYYLNHYYLVSLLVFWLIWVPAHRWYSVDAQLFPKIKSATCSNWHISIFRLQLSFVYFFAGLAKVNPDWLFKAQPMATWLPGKYQLPLIGSFMKFKETAFLFSWAGCVYDLTIWLFLWIKQTRVLAYIGVLVFHIMTGILFPRIGMFPYIMIISTIIFFSSSFHEWILQMIGGGFPKEGRPYSTVIPIGKTSAIISKVIAGYIVIQLFLPLRHLAYDGNLFWHEQGYRFSWRVMLMEKNGQTAIIVRDPVKNRQREVRQSNYLTPFQAQQMKSQPDMLLQFARHVGDEFKRINGYAPEVYVKSRMWLNGRRSQPFTNDTLDVYALDDPMRHGWILPMQESND
ncbi:MAG: HTTM domain-containing protein [Bacteroidota bacterium]